jgi:hypothetical protein
LIAGLVFPAKPLHCFLENQLGRESMTRLTFGGGYSNPLWTADGLYILFRALSQPARGIWWVRTG